jgi:hypothetical protein
MLKYMPIERGRGEVKMLKGETQSFVTSIFDTKLLQPDGKPDEEWKVSYGETWDKARSAALAAADAATGKVQDTRYSNLESIIPDAFEDADWGNIGSLELYHAWDDVRLRTLHATEYAVSVAASRSAIDTDDTPVFGAMKDAELLSQLLRVNDIEGIEIKGMDAHLAYARARWRVWQKGYALLCDVDGVMYVYAVEGKTKGLARKEALPEAASPHHRAT